jgi:nitrogenase subunit NifH
MGGLGRAGRGGVAINTEEAGGSMAGLGMAGRGGVTINLIDSLEPLSSQEVKSGSACNSERAPARQQIH